MSVLERTIASHPDAVPNVVRAFNHDLRRAPFPLEVGAVWCSPPAENGTDVSLRFRPWASPSERWEVELIFAGITLVREVGESPAVIERAETIFASDVRTAVRGAA